MTEEKRVFRASLLCVAVACALTLPLGTRVALGILSGGLWSLVNLWCLSHGLLEYLAQGRQHSRWRMAIWLIVKFPLLYLAAIILLGMGKVSAGAFGVGFTLVLMILAIVSIAQARKGALNHGA